MKLAKTLEGITKNAIVCPQMPDLRYIANHVDIPVYAQHIDSIKPGSHTGWILPEAIKESGCEGTLINHSEHTLSINEIKERVERCRDIGLKSMVCVPDIETEERVVDMEPDFIAIEPPELIGGNVSVATAKPELIEKAVEVSRGIPLLCGAGINSAEDIKIAKELGAIGVLVASAIVKSKNPKSVIESFAEYL